MANIAVNIVGNDKSASSTMNRVASNAEGMSSKLKNIGSRVAGTFGGIQLSELANKVAEFGKESVDKLSEVANETRSLQRVMGGSSESVSAFAASADRLGVTNAQLVTSMGMASKAIVTGTSVLPKLGIEVKDANGNYRTMSDLLPEIAEKFATTKNATERAAMAQQIFGRGGKALLPVLARGKDGLAEMEEEAKRTGLTMSGSAMSSTWKYQQAQISLQESVEGLQVRLGTALYPELTRLTAVLTGQIIPAIMSMFSWMQKNGTVVKIAAAAIATIVGALALMTVTQKASAAGTAIYNSVMAAWTMLTRGQAAATAEATVAQEGMDAAMDANPIGIIIVAIGLLIAAVVAIVTHWNVIWPWMRALWGDIVAYLTGVWQTIEAVASTVWNGILAFFRTVIAVVVNLFLHWTLLGTIISHMSQIRAGIVAVWSSILAFFAAIPGRIVAFFAGALSWLVGAGRGVLIGFLNAAVSGWGAVAGWFAGVGSRIGGFFAGAASWLLGAGRNIIQGLINGIGGAAGWLRDQISSVVGGITSWAKSLLGIHSPSTVFHEIGQNVGRGFANGIAAMHGVARKAMTGLVAVPDTQSMGLTSAVSGRGATAVTQQAATKSGGTWIGAIYMPSASPQQLDTELGWRNRWGI